MKKIFAVYILPLLAPACIMLSAMLVAFGGGLAVLPALVSLASVGALAYSLTQSDNSVVQTGLTVLAALAIAYFGNSLTVAALILLFYFPVGFGVGKALRKKENLNSALIGALCLFLILLLCVAVLFVYENTSPFSVADATSLLREELRTEFDGWYDFVNTFDTAALKKMGYDDILAMGKDGFADLMTETMVVGVCVAVPVFTLILTALAYFIVKAVVYKKASDGELTTPDRFRVSRITAVLFPLSFITNLIACFTVEQLSVFYILTAAVESALLTVCAGAGISLIFHVMLRVKKRSVARCRATGIILALLCLTLDFVLVIFAVIGFYDNVTDIRSRIKGGEEK